MLWSLTNDSNGILEKIDPTMSLNLIQSKFIKDFVVYTIFFFLSKQSPFERKHVWSKASLDYPEIG